MATINNTGLLTAFASGTVVVSASDVNGVVAHSGTITITNGNAAISILPYTAQLTVLQSLQFNVVGGRAPYFWSVTNPVAAKIVANTGLLTGLACGLTYVKAMDSNGMTIISGVITIQGSSTQQLSLTPNSGLLIIGQTLQFTASGGKTPYTWSSLNPSIASINTSGLLTAASSGVTTVTVRDANGITATTGQIFVSTSSGPSLSILPETASVPRGGWLQFSVSGGVPPYFWRVSNPEVGAITLTSGFFQANYLKKGTTTVTATDANGNVAETGVIEVR